MKANKIKLAFAALLIVAASVLIYWFTRPTPTFRLLRNRAIGRGGVAALFFSSDSKYFFVGSDDGVQQWDTQRARKVSEFLPIMYNSERVNNVKYEVVSAVCHPTKPLLYLGGLDHEVVVWNYELNSEAGRIPSNSLWKNVVAIDATGQYLAFPENGPAHINPESNTETYEVVVWNLNSSTEYLRVVANKSAVNSMAFLPDGSQLIVHHQDGPILVIDMAEKRISHRLGDREDSFNGNYINAYDLQLLSPINGRDEMIIGKEIWNTKTWTKEKDFFADSGYGVTSVTMDGRYGFILLAHGGRIGLVEIASGNIIGEVDQFKNHAISSLAVSPDGKTLISGGHGHRWFVKGSTNERSRDLCVWRVNPNPTPR